MHAEMLRASSETHSEEVSLEAITDPLVEQALVDAAGVVSNFERMVRIADSTGIPLGEQMEVVTATVRDELALDSFRARHQDES